MLTTYEQRHKMNERWQLRGELREVEAAQEKEGKSIQEKQRLILKERDLRLRIAQYDQLLYPSLKQELKEMKKQAKENRKTLSRIGKKLAEVERELRKEQIEREKELREATQEKARKMNEIAREAAKKRQEAQKENIVSINEARRKFQDNMKGKKKAG